MFYASFSVYSSYPVRVEDKLQLHDYSCGTIQCPFQRLKNIDPYQKPITTKLYSYLVPMILSMKGRTKFRSVAMRSQFLVFFEGKNVENIYFSDRIIN